ncbi:MAG: hypothetical protein P4L53_22620 [Candidatus Obscuribacterales bacterium]|nr:hypothetical protein [Candidatus Obscuribacterales bacterium]
MPPDDTRRPSDLNFVITLDGNKIGESALHRGNFLDSDKPATQTARNLDSIASIQLPAKWIKFEQNTQLCDATMFRHSTIESTQISLYGSRKPLDEQSSNAFKQVLNAALPSPRIIYSEKMQTNTEENIEAVKELSGAFGRTRVGDNQLSSSPSRRPAFHLDTATVETVNGKKVIAVDGWFTQLDDYAEIKMGGNGPLKRRYSGIFFEANTDPDARPKIKELYLLADDDIAFTSNKAAFRTALKSIEWK